MARTKLTDLQKYREELVGKMIRTEDVEDIILALMKNTSMKREAAEKFVKAFARSKGMKLEGLKSFKQFITEMSVQGETIPTNFDGVDYNYSRHFLIG